MKITNRLKVALKSILSIQMGEVATDKATLIWDGEGELAEGIEVFVNDESGETKPAEDGDYATEDGKVFSISEGKVAAIKEPEEEEKPEEAPESEEVAAEIQNAEIVDETEAKPADEPESEKEDEENRIAVLEARLAEITSGLNEIINAISSVEGRVSDVEAKVAKVGAEPAAEPVDEAPAVEEQMHKTRMSYLKRK